MRYLMNLTSNFIKKFVYWKNFDHTLTKLDKNKFEIRKKEGSL